MIAAFQPYFRDDVLKFSLIAEITEQGLDLTDNHLKHVDLVLQDMEDMILERLAHR